MSSDRPQVWDDERGNHHWICDGRHWYAYPKPAPVPDPQIKEFIKWLYVKAAVITIIDLVIVFKVVMSQIK